MTYKKNYQISLAKGFLQLQLNPKRIYRILADNINWETIEDNPKKYYSIYGRKTKSLRMMIGLHLAKHLKNVSDEVIVQELKDSIHLMYLCAIAEGNDSVEEFTELDPSTMTKFRERIGALKV